MVDNFQNISRQARNRDRTRRGLYAQIVSRAGERHYVADVYKDVEFSDLLQRINLFHPHDYELYVEDRCEVVNLQGDEWTVKEDRGVYIAQVRYNRYASTAWNDAYADVRQEITETFHLGLLLYEWGLPARDDGVNPSQASEPRSIPSFMYDEFGEQPGDLLSVPRVWTRRVFAEQVLLRRNSMPIPIGSWELCIRAGGNYYVQAPIFYY